LNPEKPSNGVLIWLQMLILVPGDLNPDPSPATREYIRETLEEK